jgi:hypothetical protein
MLKSQPQDEQRSSVESPGDDREHPHATRDPSDCPDALSPIETRLRRSTYRLADLNVLFMESALQTPDREVLQAEFYFGRPVIRSAVIHRCASEGSRQYAMAWLFEHAEPDPNMHLPAGEVTVSASGKVYVSPGCPVDYPLRPQVIGANRPSARAAVEAPDAAVRRMASGPAVRASTSIRRRRRTRLSGVALSLLVILAGSVFVYRNLSEPVAPSETTAAPLQGEPPTVIASGQENPIEPGLDAGTPEPAPLLTEEPAVVDEEARASEDELAVSEDELAAPEQEPPASTRHRALAKRSLPASRPTLSKGKTAASQRRSTRRPDAVSPLPPRSSAPASPLKAPPDQAPTMAEAPTADAPSLAAADPPVAIGGTAGDGVETTQPVAKEQAAPPAIAREAQPAPAPATVQRQRRQVAVANTWLTRMRAELVACGKPGLWRNDICREVTRWKYCHPDRWHTVAECRVESFR